MLWYLVFFGFAVNYMLRTNLNIAIVSMVKSRASNNFTLTSECLIEENITETISVIKQSNFTAEEVSILLSITKLIIVPANGQKYSHNI